MKLIKKIATLLLCTCLMVPCFSMMVSAVDGKVHFNDPKTEVGEEFVVVVTVKVDAGVSSLDLVLDYDPSMIEYIDAPSAIMEEKGTIRYSYDLNQNSLLRGYEIAFSFRALQEGTTRVDVSSYKIGSSFDIDWVLGYSNITIGGGSTVESTTPDDGMTDEPTMDVPTDEPTTDVPADDTTADVPTDDVPTDEPDADVAVGTGSQVVISNTTSITLMEDVTEVILSERFMETTVTVQGVPYPAWQDTEKPEMYIVYAMNTNGTKSLYQYDTLENTYQRFTAPAVENVEPEVEEDNALLELLGDNFKYVAIGAASLVLLLFVIVIVLGVKLYNRNSELDEVYDDLDEALAEKAALKKEMTSDVKETPLPIVENMVEETVDDVILTTDDAEVEEDDAEVEVEFYVAESVKEFFEEESEAVSEIEEEDDSEVEVEFYVAEESTEETVVESAPAEEKVDQPEAEQQESMEELEDDFFDDLDENFMIDFIDLDD